MYNLFLLRISIMQFRSDFIWEYFIHLEDELLSLESAVWDPQNPNDRFTVNTLLGGFGISQQLGARSALNLMFLWTLTDSGYALYNNPEIRISFTF